MARTNVATQKVVHAGLNPALTAPTVNGDVIDCGAVILWVENASGGSINVTVQSTAVVDGLDVTDLVVAVPAGQRRLIGPFAPSTFGQATGTADAGRAWVDYSAVASVTRGVVSL